jgi:hypothetical protein
MTQELSNTALSDTYNTWRIKTNQTSSFVNKIANTTGVPSVTAINLSGSGNTRLTGANLYVTATHSRFANTVLFTGSNTNILGAKLLISSNTLFNAANTDFRNRAYFRGANTDFYGSSVFAKANVELQGANTNIRGSRFFVRSNTSLSGANTTIAGTSHHVGRAVFKSSLEVLKNSSNTVIRSKSFLATSNTVLSGATTTITGNTTVGGFTKSKTYRETYTTASISSNTITLNLNTAQNFGVNLNATVTTVNFNNPPAGANAFGFTVMLTGDGTQRQITWPTSVKWAANTIPIASSRNATVDIFTFFTRTGGTVYYGFVAGQDFY